MSIVSAASTGASDVGLGQVALSEVLGTATLLLFGIGVVANVLLPRTKGFGTGWLLISWGWGLGVFCGIYIAWRSGAHLNPAVTFGLLTSGAQEYAPGVPVNVTTTVVYLIAEMIGAMLGAVLAWLAYKQHFDQEAEPATKLGCFATAPEIRKPVWNLVTEVIGTFVLVYVILQLANTPSEMGPLPVALLVFGIGATLGGPTGYAINPARDLGPRIVHALLPIKGKGGSDWGYAWVPVLGPLIGGVLAGALAQVF